MANPLDPKTDAGIEPKPFLSGMSENNTDTGNSSFSEKIEASIASEKSTIGKKIKFRGELVGSEDLHIEGTVEGTVIMDGQNLSIGREGEVNANVHAQNIIINGALTGDVLAEELIEICNTAIVKGNLIAPRIQLDDGGKFRGSMDMVDSDEDMRERRAEFQAKLVHPHLPVADVEKPVVQTPRAELNKPALDNKKFGDVKKGNEDKKSEKDTASE